jgi:hypothetical protein
LQKSFSNERRRRKKIYKKGQSTTRLKVSAADFERIKKGLRAILRAIQTSGNDGISTKELLYKVENDKVR